MMQYSPDDLDISLCVKTGCYRLMFTIEQQCYLQNSLYIKVFKPLPPNHYYFNNKFNNKFNQQQIINHQLTGQRHASPFFNGNQREREGAVSIL